MVHGCTILLRSSEHTVVSEKTLLVDNLREKEALNYYYYYDYYSFSTHGVFVYQLRVVPVAPVTFGLSLTSTA